MQRRRGFVYGGKSYAGVAEVTEECVYHFCPSGVASYLSFSPFSSRVYVRGPKNMVLNEYETQRSESDAG